MTDPFYLWWVAEVGRPPVAGEEEAFRLARSAWDAREANLRSSTGLTRGRRPYATDKHAARLLRERDWERSNVDEYRRVAGLKLGEFLGPEVTVARIRDRLESMTKEVTSTRFQLDESQHRVRVIQRHRDEAIAVARQVAAPDDNRGRPSEDGAAIEAWGNDADTPDAERATWQRAFSLGFRAATQEGALDDD